MHSTTRICMRCFCGISHIPSICCFHLLLMVLLYWYFRTGSPIATGRWHRPYPSFSSSPVVSSRCSANRNVAASCGSPRRHSVRDNLDNVYSNTNKGQQQPSQRRPGQRQPIEEENASSSSSSSIHSSRSRRVVTVYEETSSFFAEGGSLSRRGVLRNTAGLMAGLLAGVGLAGIATGAPTAALAEQEQQQQEQQEGALEEYVSPDASFALRYPANFKGFSKPLKTHKVEVS